MLLNCGVGEDSWESLGQQGDQISQSYRKSVLNIHCKDWCWSWSSSTLATWWKNWPTGKDPDAGKDLRQEEKRMTEDEMASLTWWTLVWASSRSWYWTGKPGMLQSMGLKVLDMTEWLNWIEHQESLAGSLSPGPIPFLIWLDFYPRNHNTGQ